MRYRSGTVFATLTNRPNKLDCFITPLEMLTSDKYSNLLGQFLITKKMKYCEYTPSFATLHFLFNIRMGPLSYRTLQQAKTGFPVTDTLAHWEHS